jgi:hypothetical protein
MSRRSTSRLTVLLPLLALIALHAAAASGPEAGAKPKEPLWTAERLAKMMAAYHQALPGTIRVLDFKIYDRYARMQVQDPAKPENVDQYDYRGRVSEPVPVKLAGKGSLEANLFDLDAVAFDRIPALVEEAAAKLPVEGGKLGHILIRRGLPFTKDVRITLYMNGTRKDGMLKADAKGRVLEAREH